MNCQTEIRYGFVNNSGSVFYCPPCVDRGHIPKDDPFGVCSLCYHHSDHLDEYNTCPACLKKTPAHEVPFAYKPGTTVTEKFTVEIKTEETGEYCACARCVAARSTILGHIIRARVQNFLDHRDPFFVFPEKQKVEVFHNQTLSESPR